MECQINSNLSHFASISHTNELSILDIKTYQYRPIYNDKYQYSHKIACFRWKQKIVDNNISDVGLYAMGFDDGMVIVWDLLRGIAQTVCNHPTQTKQTGPAPTALEFSLDGNSLFIGSNQNEILQYNISNGAIINKYKCGKKGVQKMAINPKVPVLAIASTSIKLLDIESGRKKKLIASFSGGIHSIMFSPCGRLLIASSKRNREVVIFDVRVDASLEPIEIISVPHIPIDIDVKSIYDNIYGEILEILVIFEDNKSLSIIQYSLDYANKKLQGVDTILNTTTIQSDEPILCGKLGNENHRESNGVFLCFGLRTAPYFKHCNIIDASGNLLKNIKLHEFYNKIQKQQLNSSSIEGSVIGAEKVIGPFQMGGIKRPRIEESIKLVESKTKKDKSSQLHDDLIHDGMNGVDDDAHDYDGHLTNGYISNGLNGLTSSSKIDHNASDMIISNELTLQEKLEQLSKSLNQVEENVITTSSSTGVDKNMTPTTDSMVSLIEQSLQSNDNSLLEQCFACTDEAVIQETVHRLPIPTIIPLLKNLVTKMEKRPARGMLLLFWLHSILRYHTGYLISIRELSIHVAGLSNILSHRLSTYSKLSSLSGRLDLLLFEATERETRTNTNLHKMIPEQIIFEE